MSAEAERTVSHVEEFGCSVVIGILFYRAAYQAPSHAQLLLAGRLRKSRARIEMAIINIFFHLVFFFRSYLVCIERGGGLKFCRG